MLSVVKFTLTGKERAVGKGETALRSNTSRAGSRQEWLIHVQANAQCACLKPANLRWKLGSETLMPAYRLPPDQPSSVGRDLLLFIVIGKRCVNLGQRKVGMLKMYFFRAGSISDLVQNDFGNLDVCTGNHLCRNSWGAAVVDFNLRGDPACHWLQHTPACLGAVASPAPAEADQALLDRWG
jgi:hypothetical protein